MDHRRITALGGVLIALSLLSSGCASTRAAQAAPQPAPSHSVTIVPADEPVVVRVDTPQAEAPDAPVAGPAPSPGATTPPDPDAVPPASSPESVVTCRSLLDTATLDRVDRNENGLVLLDDVVDASSPEALGVLVASGGVVCNLGYLGTDSTYLYGWSPLTLEQSAELVTRLADVGYVAETGPTGALHCNPEPDPINQATSCYLIRAADVVYSSSRDALDDRVALLG